MESGAKPTQWWQMTIIHIFQSMRIDKKELRSSSLLLVARLKNTHHALKNADVAQRVEQWSEVPRCGGSIPFVSIGHRHHYKGVIKLLFAHSNRISYVFTADARSKSVALQFVLQVVRLRRSALVT